MPAGQPSRARPRGPNVPFRAGLPHSTINAVTAAYPVYSELSSTHAHVDPLGCSQLTTRTGANTRRSLTQLSADTIVYGLSVVAFRLAPLLLTPLYTRMLTPPEFGANEIIASYTLIASTALILGTDAAANIYYFRDDSAEGRRQLVGSWLALIATIAMLATAVLFVLSPALLQLLSLDARDTLPLELATIGIPFIVVSAVLLEILRFSFARWRYVLTALASAVIMIVSGAILVGPARQGLQGVFESIILGYVASCAAGLWFNWPQLGFGRFWHHSQRLLRFGLPLTLAAVGYWGVNSANRLFLAHYSLVDLAIFAAGSKVSQAISFFTLAFSLAWGPYAPSIATSHDCRDVYARVLVLYSAVVSGLILALTVIAPAVLVLIAPASYQGGNAVVGLLAASIAVYGAYYIVSIGAYLTDRSIYLAWSTLLGGLASVAACAPLIGLSGSVGAAQAALIGSCVTVSCLYILAQRRYHIPFRLGLTLTFPSLAVTAALCSSSLHTVPLISVSVKLASVGIYVAVALALVVRSQGLSFTSLLPKSFKVLANDNA